MTKLARPLPVVYLLIDMNVATPKEPTRTFYQPAAGSPRFPIENRPMENHLQTLGSLWTYRQSVPSLPNFFRDFHLLLFLTTCEAHPLSLQELRPLLEAVRERREDAVMAWAQGTEQWQTMELLMQHSAGGFS